MVTWNQLQKEELFISNKNTYCYLTKNLPVEIIEIIISYLNPTPRELFILALSKLFLPALVQFPNFIPKINNFFNHSLLTYFTTQKELIKYFRPFLYNNQFFFSFSTYIIDQNIDLFTKTDLSPLTCQFTNLFTETFTSHPYYFPLYDCTIFNKCLPCEHLTFVCAFYKPLSKLVRLPITPFDSCNCLWNFTRDCYFIKASCP